MITALEQFAKHADHSFTDRLNCDPDADPEGEDYAPREVVRGHYVPVRPTPISNPEYIAHSGQLFHDLGIADSMARSEDFMRLFSGDTSVAPSPMRRAGWACGYALSIYGNEFTSQCPFQTGNGYGDGRAISIVEVLINGRRWEMQLKGAGRTPYCRGADGRAVLRSSVREFLAQEYMHALGVPTSRSLTLYVSKTEKVRRPWYSQGSRSLDPDRLVAEPVAVATRVAPSFIRVGQLELFARRARRNEHPYAMEELEELVVHLIDREYSDVIDQGLSTPDKVLVLAREFRDRLTRLVADWIRVGYCQGNFNSDNCAAGGFTLDYGPFGFCEVFDPRYQPWTGGGDHFSLFNQTAAAERNFQMFCTALRPLLIGCESYEEDLDGIERHFPHVMREKMQRMWADKLGLEVFDAKLVNELHTLMAQTPVDYTIFFRKLSNLPEDLGSLETSFYSSPSSLESGSEGLHWRWSQWLRRWRQSAGIDTASLEARQTLSSQMKRVNPRYSLREWFLMPAYQQAAEGDYASLRELHDVMTQPYAEQSKEILARYDRKKPSELFNVGGLSHYSCSS